MPNTLLNSLKRTDYTDGTYADPPNIGKKASEVNGATLYPDRQFSVMRLISAAGPETRTVSAPTKSGLIFTLDMVTDGGDITVTVTGGYDEAGSTTLTFSAIGQFATLISIEQTADTFVWRLLSYDGVAGPALDLSIIDVDTLKIGGTTVTATAAEINQACDESANTEIVTATNVITASESGKTFFLNSATEFVSTLPAPALGLRFKFIVTAAPAAASYTVVAAAAATIIRGHVLTSQDAGGTADSETTGVNALTFVDGKAVVGDWAEFVCDGTNYYVQASSKVFDAITLS